MGLLDAPRIQVFPLLCPRCGKPMRIMVVAARVARAAYMRDYRSRPRTEEEVTAERARKAGYYEAALRRANGG